MNNLQAKIEAVLFIYGEPIKIKKLAEIIEVEESEAREGLLALGEKIKGDDRGLNLMILDDKAALVTKPELQDIVKKIVKEELDSDLSPASLETLAIIAYLGPVSRVKIDYIRGVNSSFILRNLLVRGLIQKEGGKDKTGNNLYNITFDFFKHIGVNSQMELPDFDKYKSLIDQFTGQPVPNIEPQS